MDGQGLSQDALRYEHNFSPRNGGTVPTGADRLRLRIEFLLDEGHDQIEPLRLDQRGDCIENLVAIARMCDSQRPLSSESPNPLFGGLRQTVRLESKPLGRFNHSG